MAFNGSGVFQRIYSWVSDAANNIPITASRFDTEDSGFAAGLSNCITKDGQQTITNNIPFSGFRITNLGDPASAQDAVTLNTITNPTNVTAGQYFKQTAAEIAAGVTPSQYSYPPGNTGRYASASNALSQLDHAGAPVVSGGAMVLEGQVGAIGVSRTGATLILQNTAGSAISTLEIIRNVNKDAEAAISFEGVNSAGADVQYAGYYARFVNDDNTAGSYQTCWGVHVPGPTQDWGTFNAYSNNSVRLTGPSITTKPWNTVPFANSTEVYTYLWSRSGLKAGPDLVEYDSGTHTGLTPGYGLEIQGAAQFGNQTAGHIDKCIQMGHNGTTAFIQGYINTGSAYEPLQIAGSTISITGGDVKPASAGTLNLGSAILPWANIYAVNALHVTSDQRMKDNAGPFTDADKALAIRLKGMVRKYQWKSEPDGKIHIGMYAQEVEQATRECGVDIDKLAFLDKENGGYSLVYTEIILYIMANT